MKPHNKNKTQKQNTMLLVSDVNMTIGNIPKPSIMNCYNKDYIHSKGELLID